jgi:hypothetical protein
MDVNTLLAKRIRKEVKNAKRNAFPSARREIKKEYEKLMKISYVIKTTRELAAFVNALPSSRNYTFFRTQTTILEEEFTNLMLRLSIRIPAIRTITQTMNSLLDFIPVFEILFIRDVERAQMLRSFLNYVPDYDLSTASNSVLGD